MKNASSNFSHALDKVLFQEGGYVNDPLDRGGETKFGISKKAYPWLDIANLSLEDASAIYKRDYWDKLRLDEIQHPEIAEKIFDMAVNMGPGSAVLILQRALNFLVGATGFSPLTADGVMGPMTLSCANQWCRKDFGSLRKALKGFQFMRYAEIVRTRPDQARFARGWLKRV
ncbi:MAG: glycosyl hydrolase 108 family protein [Thermodesulfobacteriota bacterium]|nr:glycosyl hydrolase 108 family protein [Thermodesulfobacteriota bacterium]